MPIAYRYDLTEFHPSWDGGVSAREVDRITAWPDMYLDQPQIAADAVLRVLGQVE